MKQMPLNMTEAMRTASGPRNQRCRIGACLSAVVVGGDEGGRFAVIKFYTFIANSTNQKSILQMKNICFKFDSKLTLLT